MSLSVILNKNHVKFIDLTFRKNCGEILWFKKNRFFHSTYNGDNAIHFGFLTPFNGVYGPWLYWNFAHKSFWFRLGSSGGFWNHQWGFFTDIFTPKRRNSDVWNVQGARKLSMYCDFCERRLFGVALRDKRWRATRIFFKFQHKNQNPRS